MIAAHCSKTIENFFGLKNLPLDKNISEINTWSVQIFRADGQKHLFFLNHFTHFSVVVFNIKKKDKEVLDQLFWKAFISEIRRANISSYRIEKTLQKHLNGITYCSKSRNKKTNQSLIDRKTVFQNDRLWKDLEEKVTIQEHHLSSNITFDINNFPAPGHFQGSSSELMEKHLEEIFK